MLYSATTKGFYRRDVHGKNIPGDAVDVADAHYKKLFEGQSQGKLIVPDSKGNPVLASHPPRSLDELKAEKNKEINRARAAANTGSFSHEGKEFAVDVLSRSDIDGVNGYVAIFGVLPSAFPGAWKAIDNSYFPIADVHGWKAFYAAMVVQGGANFARAQELKRSLQAAKNAAAVAAIVW